jgi:hypothetical protein
LDGPLGRIKITARLIGPQLPQKNAHTPMVRGRQ